LSGGSCRPFTAASSSRPAGHFSSTGFQGRPGGSHAG
jgi:hypothetical protein